MVLVLSVAQITGAAANPAAPGKWLDVARSLYAAIDQVHPGRGVTDYPGNTVEDIPKSTAMVLLAELDRTALALDPQKKSLAPAAGRWLLDHADENRNGIVGWGVPVAWDAYGDGSVNPAHTEYTISTAIAVDALLTWRARDPKAPKKEILDKVGKALEPYLDGAMKTPSGLAPYSLRESDRPYDTFNPAAYLAGQMQRYSGMVQNAKQQAALRAAADATMDSLLRHHKVSAAKHWYWNYSVQENVPNDLPHASYVIDGIKTYMAYGGRLSGQFDRFAVLGHLREFPAADGVVRGWPAFRTDVATPARSYDLGFALSVACSEESLADVRAPLFATLSRYRTPQGRYAKNPLGTDEKNPLIVGEYEAYLYRGVMACLRAQSEMLDTTTGPSKPLKTSAAATRLVEDAAFPAYRPSMPVPLLDPSLGTVVLGGNLEATVHRGRSTLQFDDPGLPLAVLEDGARQYVIFRSFPSDTLTLRTLGADSKLLCTTAISHGDANAIFRAASVHAGRIYVAYFDNPGSANWVVNWPVETLCASPAPSPVREKMASLEDPAGSTYEMIPALRFMAHVGTLYLVGGTLEVALSTDGHSRMRRVPACRHVVESAATPQGLAHLCVSPSPRDNGARSLVIVAPPGLAAPAVDAARGVPWGLAWSQDKLQVDYARSADQLRAVFMRDFLAAQHSGWLEAGINNDEGRIPWSQIYYANGLLDLLNISHRSESASRLFAPLLLSVRQRLDLEISLIDRHYTSGRFRTRAFTVDRSQALFAVQTARLLLLLQRYRDEIPAPVKLASFEKLKQDVLLLRNHIDVLAREGEQPEWIPLGKAHLRWPKGSKFYFDGLPVPYNQQNEWAYAVAKNADLRKHRTQLQTAHDISQLFMDRIAPQGNLPASGEWDYWWGHAFDGWSRADGISQNNPEYPGDKGKAWISFRTIDAMSLVTVTQNWNPAAHKNALRTAAELTSRGMLYPLANQSISTSTGKIHLEPAVAWGYSRLTSPWELANVVWSLSRLAPEVRP